jgi:hypothetical protein
MELSSASNWLEMCLSDMVFSCCGGDQPKRPVM